VRQFSPTPRQAEALAFITDFIRQRGYGPSHREIGEGLNPPVGPETTRSLLRGLADRGLVHIEKGRKRAVIVIEQSRAA
jgi:SOS-response transcriptional repressor LexA